MRTLEEVRGLLQDYEKAETSGSSLGCVEFQIESSSLDEHYGKTMAALQILKLTAYDLVFVRVNADYSSRNGELPHIYTRLFFGVKGHSITPQQYSHINREEGSKFGPSKALTWGVQL